MFSYLQLFCIARGVHRDARGVSSVVGYEADELEEPKDPDGDDDVTKAARGDGELVEAIVYWDTFPSTDCSPKGEEDVLRQNDDAEYCLAD